MKSYNYIVNKIDGIQLFCSHCRNMNTGLKIDLREDHISSRKQPTITCPSCGTVIPLIELSVIENKNPREEYLGHKIFKEQDKVVLSLLTRKVTARENKLQITRYNDRLVFNTKTGQTYLMASLNLETNKYIGRKIQNVSYGEAVDIIEKYEAWYGEELYQAVREKVLRVNPYAIELSDIGLRSIISLNRYPLMPYETLKSIPKALKYKGYGELKYIKNTDINPWRTFCDLLQIDPPKSSMKLIKANLTRAYAYKNISSKVSVDNANKIIREDYGDMIQQIAEFIDIAKQCGQKETTIVNKIIDCCWPPILGDTIEMLIDIRRYRPEITIDFRGSIEQMHDRFSKVLEEVKHPRKDIKISLDELSIETTINGYKFVVAKDTDTLLHIGNRMNICVGTIYRRPALAKECTIVSVTSDSESEEACIELRQDANRKFILRQAKVGRNNRPEGAIRNAIAIWVIKHGIILDTTDIELNEEDYKRADECVIEYDSSASNVLCEEDEISEIFF